MLLKLLVISYYYCIPKDQVPFALRLQQPPLHNKTITSIDFCTLSVQQGESVGLGFKLFAAVIYFGPLTNDAELLQSY